MHQYGRVMVIVAAVTTLMVAGVVYAEGTFEATLVGTEEVPPVQTATKGKALVVFNADDTAASFRLQVRRGVRITQAHIHCAPQGVNGPIVAFLAGLNSQGYDVDGFFPWINSATLTDTSVIPSDPVSKPACPNTINNLRDLIAAIRAGNAYVNVHSIAYPGGEVRGQLAEAPPPAAR
jgi:hypothetical protein